MAAQIGIIAEGKSDIETLYAFACNLGDEKSFKFRHFVAHGSGKLRKKCGSWAKNLKARGCDYLIVIHDLDDRVEQDLRADLDSRVRIAGFSDQLILIPIRELEAWLLCDRKALKIVFRTKGLPVTPSNPESVADPKAELRKTVRKAGGSTYVNTLHNSRIASKATVSTVAKRCPSFSQYVNFMRAILE